MRGKEFYSDSYMTKVYQEVNSTEARPFEFLMYNVVTGLDALWAHPKNALVDSCLRRNHVK